MDCQHFPAEPPPGGFCYLLSNALSFPTEEALLKTIGELIDALLNSETSCIWLNMVCRHTDADTMAQFRALPILPENIQIFSQTIAAQIRAYLVGVCTEERFESIHSEGKEFFEAVWQIVKDMGIPREAVCVPISYTDMAVEAGVVTVNDGMVSLTDAGRQTALDFENGT